MQQYAHLGQQREHLIPTDVRINVLRQNVENIREREYLGIFEYHTQLIQQRHGLQHCLIIHWHHIGRIHLLDMLIVRQQFAQVFTGCQR